MRAIFAADAIAACRRQQPSSVRSVAQQRGKPCGRRKIWPAQPIDRAFPGHQGRRLAISNQGIVGNPGTFLRFSALRRFPGVCFHTFPLDAVPGLRCLFHRVKAALPDVPTPCYAGRMAGFDSIADMMYGCAAEAVAVAQEEFGFTLDYSHGSVESLETVLASTVASMDASDKAALEHAVKCWGSYLGEVVRKNFGGQWELIQYPGRAAAVPALVIDGSQLYPLMKVYRRLTVGDAENVRDFYAKIRNRLSPVQPTDRFAG